MVAALALVLALSAVPTPTQLESLGRELEAKFNGGTDGLAPVMDAGALAARTLEGLEGPASFKESFASAFKKSGSLVGQALLAALNGGGRLSYRKPVTLDGHGAVQLRLLTAGGGFNVLELMVEPDAAGNLRVVDLFDLMAGELKSQEIRRWALIALAEGNRSFVDRLMGREQTFVKNVPQIRAFTLAVREGRTQDAVALFEALPEEVQRQRSLLRLYATAASEVNDAKYRRALAKYLSLYPKDVAGNAIAIDYYFLKKRWAEAEKAISVVEARVGTDDGWFEVLRANAAVARGQPAEAKRHLLAAIARERTLSDPYFSLVDFALAEKDWAAAARWLEAVQRDAGVELQDVSTVPAYAAFAASKEGRAFVKRQRAAATGGARPGPRR